MMKVLSKLFGDANEKYLKKIQPIVEQINNLEQEFEGFSDEKLRLESEKLKEELKKGKTLDDILPKAFALTREAAKRTLNQRHFDVQLIGGIILHQGRIGEMKTGEGKTLASTMPIYLNALTDKGVHVVTVNDYLAKRDTVWMGQIYHLLGLSVGCLVHDTACIYDPEFQEKNQESRIKNQESNSERDEERDTLGGFKVIESYLRPCSRKEAYQANITYGTNNEFGFDYLRDNMVYDLKDKAQREFNFAIVDEVDSILIDEARTPLIISAPDMEATKAYGEFAKIIPQLKKESDYEIDEKMKAVTLTEPGIEKIEKILGMDNIYQEKGIKYLHHLEQSLRAQALFKKDRDYVVKDGQVIIVDDFTGRLLPGRRYSGGLHQAIEAKEGVAVQPESKTLASITFQNYFRLYDKLAGMTGTAATSAEEFDKVYGLEVVIIPTNKPMIREVLPDRIYKTESGKFKAVVAEIKERHQKGQPVLVGTTSIEKNEYLGKLLDREGVPHQILNAKHHQKEGEIIAQAGRYKAVTIATNMAGRGVDIILGGNPPNKEEAEKVVKSKGLSVIGTERHEARRIDNQLRGRSGRQGDPGSSQFFVSLADDLLRIFGGERIQKMMEMLKIPEDQAIEAKMVSGVIESAQEKIEGMNFDLRKHLLDYDDVLNKHREVIYKKRREILEAKSEERKAKIIEMVKKQGKTEQDYEKKEKEIGEENMRKVEKIISLRSLDFLWMDHLENMEYLRDSVRLRAYGQQDPLVEYKNEGHKMFRQLLNMIETNIVDTLFRVSLVKPEEKATVSAPAFSQPSTSVPSHNEVGPRYEDGARKNKPGRNDPCPCGSGKKYKKCCYPKYG
ncbi:preprotein translocase subunit SecA [Candidatus Parcubacteria bacterium]|nr:preprotein translocase subunit SecA [Candidatus Parcubacteria bacterium]